MPHAASTLRNASTVIVLPIGRHSPFVDELPDTLLFIMREPHDGREPRHDIAEYVHEIGAMAVVA